MLVAVFSLSLYTATAQISHPIYNNRGGNGFETYLVPSAVQTKSGTLPAFEEVQEKRELDTCELVENEKRSDDSGRATICDDGDVSVLYEADIVVPLYPGGQNADVGICDGDYEITLGPAESNGFDRPEEVNEFGNCSYVGDNARMEIYLPEKNNGQMVIVCPGGGYSTVCARKEGEDVAKWMARRGIATCVVIYRLPNGHPLVPLMDVQNAFRYCRHYADRWGINQIGVMGFSAGGHLAAMVSNLYVDDLTKPDFSILIYPVIDLDHHEGTFESLTGGKSRLKNKYSMQYSVTAETPRTFIALSQNDKIVDVNSSLCYYNSLRRSGVKAELYVYPTGGHGYGFLNEEVHGRKDALGNYRSLFSDCLDKFLIDIQEK